MRWELRAFDALTLDASCTAILRLRQDVFIVEQKCAYADADGADERALHLFAVDGDDVVACARLFAPGVRRDEAVIGRVVTAARVRKLGVGRELMRRAIAARRGASTGASPSGSARRSTCNDSTSRSASCATATTTSRTTSRICRCGARKIRRRSRV